ncbi:hypothetical protein ONE63_011419 [Megalurothrips usitatus]|uniref:Ubiquitin-like protease family profile domain-containing protein n=1 Tax=Megalurothrips usitatus TaxID=439358 RepID=A0AAV7WZC0_9NEOP|nr:hypothetical protein ONE63_011419 [Megalurothrips usitatus]
MALIKEKIPKTWVFPTQFYEKISSAGEDSVNRWTKNVNIFDCSLIIIPVHRPGHWSLVIVSVPEKTITCFNSLGPSTVDQTCADIIMKYLTYEAKARGRSLNTQEWKTEMAKNVTMQNNSIDCGVFVCYYARMVSEGKRCNHPPSVVHGMRLQVAKEVLACKLLPGMVHVIRSILKIIAFVCLAFILL